MEAIINNFRMSRHRQKMNHLILTVRDINDKKKASKLVDKKVVWTSPAGKEIVGKVASAHGNKGRLRAIFDKGLPGQALGKKVRLE